MLKIFKNKVIFSLLIVLVTITLFMGTINIISPTKVMEDNPFIVGKDGRPLIAAHRRGMSVQYWTINEKEEMIKLIKLGVDVIMTDNLDVLYEVLVKMGYYN